MNYENNLLSILSWASTRSSWVSVSSCADMAGVEYGTTYRYFERDDFVQVAARYRFDYRIRPRHKGFLRDGTTRGTSMFLSCISRGYGT